MSTDKRRSAFFNAARANGMPASALPNNRKAKLMIKSATKEREKPHDRRQGLAALTLVGLSLFKKADCAKGIADDAAE